MTIGMWRLSATEADNLTLDAVRLAGLISVLGASLGIILFLVLVTWAFFSETKTFDAMQYGTGFAAILAGVGAFMLGMGVAKGMEPRAPQTVTTTTETPQATVTSTVTPAEEPLKKQRKAK